MKAGEEMDFDELYKTYFKDVYNFLYKLSGDHALSEDITQETFIKAIKNLKNFRGDCKVSVWLCQIAKNTYFTYLKKHSKFTAVPLEESKNIGESFDFTSRQSLLEIHRVLHDLPEPYKEVFTLRTFGDLSLVEISQLFKKSESWARVTYLRAKQKLQALLTENHMED